MLNYILPPIIIIISVSVLIMFLFRKAEQIPEQELSVEEQTNRSPKRMKFFVSTLGQFGLKILERLMHRSKLMSLKFHNMSNVWFQSIREKRQERLQIHQEMFEKEVEEISVAEKSFSTPNKVNVVSNEPKEVRPMIRETITKPQTTSKIIEKNKFEDALIKRIAINPRDIEAYERLGDYYLESENFQDALECFKQVLRLSPTHQKARLRIRRLEKAIK